jgi:hypothetical protein
MVIIAKIYLESLGEDVIMEQVFTEKTSIMNEQILRESQQKIKILSL